MPRTKARQSRTPRSRVSFADADRVRRHLLSESVTMLTTKDVRTMVRIINDVYPKSRSWSAGRTTTASPAATPFWQPLLVGMGIGVVLLILALAAV